MTPAFESAPSRAAADGSALPRLAGGRIGAVVEVAADGPERLPAELIASTYRASGSALMILVCHGVSRAAVDAALTPTVREVGPGVRGVLYLDGEDDDAVREAVRTAPLVVASSERFRARLSEWGVPFIEPGDALHRFRSWSGRPREP